MMTKDDLEKVLWPLIRTVNPGIAITGPEIDTLHATLMVLGFQPAKADDLTDGLHVNPTEATLFRVLDAARARWHAVNYKGDQA
jgi:hypothetical protein